MDRIVRESTPDSLVIGLVAQPEAKASKKPEPKKKDTTGDKTEEKE